MEEVASLTVAVCCSNGFFLLFLLARFHAASMFSKNASAVAASVETHRCKAERPSLNTYFSYAAEKSHIKGFFSSPSTGLGSQKLLILMKKRHDLPPYGSFSGSCSSREPNVCVSVEDTASMPQG